MQQSFTDRQAFEYVLKALAGVIARSGNQKWREDLHTTLHVIVGPSATDLKDADYEKYQEFFLRAEGYIARCVEEERQRLGTK